MALADFGLTTYQRNRGAALTRDAQLAQNAYTRFLSQDRGTRQLADLTRNQTNGMQRFASSFGRRGLQNSGIFNQAQSDYAQNYMRQQQAIQDQMNQDLNQSLLNDATAWMNFDVTTGNSSEEKYNNILQTAAGIQRATGG
jgi:hypothetical protein